MKLSITNPQNPLQCGIRLQEHRKTGEPLTPDFCRNILISTANQGIASKLLDLIGAHLEENPGEIDRFLPYMETMVERITATPKVVEKAAQIANAHFPYDNFTAEEFSFANRLNASTRHSNVSADVAEKLLKRVKAGYHGDTKSIYDPDNPHFNLKSGVYEAYPEMLADDFVRLLEKGIAQDEAMAKLYTPVNMHDLTLLNGMANLFEPYAAEIWRQNPDKIFIALGALSKTAALPNRPAEEKDLCAGCFKRTLKALKDIPPLPQQALDTSLELVPLLLDAAGERPANADFPDFAEQSAKILQWHMKPIIRLHWVEAFLPKMLELKINVEKELDTECYRCTPALLNMSLNELASRANSTTEARYLLHNCFSFHVGRETAAQWLRYPETSGAMLYEDYKTVLRDGGFNLSEIAGAVNRGARANFRLIAMGNREPRAGMAQADLRNASLEALLNVYCEAYEQNIEPPEEIYKTLYNVRFGKIGRLEGDTAKPQEVFRDAVKALKYKELPSELSKLARPSYGYQRLLLKKPYAR